VYVDGRIQYREYVDAENNKKQISEIVIDDMVILDNKGMGNGGHAAHEDDLSAGPVDVAPDAIEDIVIPDDIAETPAVADVPAVETPVAEELPVAEETKDEEKATEDLPF
jgi:single-stranded DNA-binding protein